MLFKETLTYLLTPWLSGPLRAVACLNTDAHSCLSSAFCRHLLTIISLRSFPTSSIHLTLGLPLVLLPSCLLSNIFLTILPWSIPTTCPVHSSLFFLTSATMSRSLYSSFNSWSLILHISYSNTGPHILDIFPSHVPSLFISISVTAHVSLPTLQLVWPSFYVLWF